MENILMRILHLMLGEFFTYDFTKVYYSSKQLLSRCLLLCTNHHSLQQNVILCYILHNYQTKRRFFQ
jgi:hypothetical protein